jgi:nucleotide-binding universal stress UspA family protein
VNPFDRILVPLGPAPIAERALVVALDLVRRTGVPLRLLSVATPVDEDELAARLAAVPGRGGVPTDVETRVTEYGSIAEAITAAAEPGTLVCMSSHGGYGPGRMLVGSVTEDVLRSVEEPVLVVGPGVPPDVSMGDGRMVACLDGSPYSERTLAPAQRWSRAFGLPLWLVQVAPPEGPTPDEAGPDDVPPEHHLDALARSLGGVEGWRVVHDRHPARALAAMAENVPVAAFVMATHGRTGWSRVLVGSTTASAVHQASVPVLVVPAVPPGR